MIVAVDTEGDVYISLTQVNTDTSIMKIYLYQLAQQLDIDRPGWRENTIIQFDNAKYHKGVEIQEFMKRLGMEIIYTEPRSYDGCVAELFFAWFKSANLNPFDKPMGKKR